MNDKEKQKENLFRHTKQFIYSLKQEKRLLNTRLYEIERLEREILIILSNPELANELLKIDED
ncbi:MAG: hypothetical protein VZS44_11240 [Bacilli bacterium]|nr:hypothetical protein [Bacilli bacterium]